MLIDTVMHFLLLVLSLTAKLTNKAPHRTRKIIELICQVAKVSCCFFSGLNIIRAREGSLDRIGHFVDRQPGALLSGKITVQLLYNRPWLPVSAS